MTDFNRVFIDSAPLIYFLENDANFGERSKYILNEILSKGKGLSTSVVTYEEFLVHPYQSNDAERVQSLFDFLGDCHVQIEPITLEIAQKAARIRAKYKDIKGMDALQLATAVIGGCDLFLTNDRQLRQYDEIKCVMLEEWR